MFDKMFNGLFGKIQPGMCRMTMNGNIAVKCSNGYKTYNLKKERLTNVSNFCFDIGSDFFFVIPTNRVVEGDIILVDGKPKCVIETSKKIITVIDYENSEIRQVVPERHVFMGNTYFYGKIVSLFGTSFKSGKGMGNIMKMMMFSQLMGGKSMFGGQSGAATGDGMGNMGQMMAMSMFMGGGNNMFEDMFNGLDFSGASINDDDDEDDDEDDSSKKSNNDED